MPPVKGQMFRYSEEDMEKAVEEVLRGQAVATTAKKYGIPRVTLLYKSRGKTPRKRKMGPQPYLSVDQENILAKWIVDIAKAGFPVQKEQLMSSVKNLMEDLNQKNVFKDNKPGRTWLAGFLRRNPQISIRTAQNLTSTRAGVKKEAIQQWFHEVYSYLEANKYERILNEPTRVFNSDETAFFLNPKGNKVLAAKGDKSVYQQINPDEKECLTVLITGNAAGQLAPPAVLFKYERIPREIALSVPDKWGIGKSESGWMTGETFYEFITNIFDKWLTEMNIIRPVILFIDGHASHLTLHTSRFCDEHGIILVALFPNATHILQPMDVAVFRSLKRTWKDAVHQWRLDHSDSPILRKVHFCPLLKTVVEEKVAPSILINGFRKCGLVPWNVEAITFPNEQINHKEKEQRIHELKNGRGFLDKYIEKNKIAAFKKNEIWNGDIHDLSLFEFYKNIEKQIKILCEAVESREHNREDVTINTLNDSVIDHSMQSITRDPGSSSAAEVPRRCSVTQETGTPLTTQEPILSSLNQETTTSLKTQKRRSLSGLEIGEPEIPVLNIEDVITANHTIDNTDLDALRKLYATPVKLTNGKTIAQEPCTSSDIQEPCTSSAMPQGKSRQTFSEIVPSPFKRVLFWPGPKKQTTKRRKTEKNPAVVTSKEWQTYHESKENKKIRLLDEKKKRAEERQKKKEITDTLKRIKKEQIGQKIRVNKQKRSKKIQNVSSSEDETWVESGSSINDLSSESSGTDDLQNNAINYQFHQDDYVLVKFPGKKREHMFACIIQKILKNKEAEVIALNYCDGNKSIFKTNDKDVSVINYAQIIRKLPAPKMVLSGDRLRYHFDKPIEVDG